MVLDRACTAYGLPTEPMEHGLLRVGGVGGGQARRTVEAERQEIGFATWSEAKQFGGDKSTVLFSQRRAKTYDDETLKYVWQDAQFKKLKNIIDFPHF